MADDNDDLDKGGDQGGNDDGAKKKTPEVDVTKVIEEKVAEELKGIKANLDKAYAARDELAKKVKDFEKQERERELKRLEDEGKHREVYEARLKEEREAREAAEKRNVELTRDLELKGVLSNFPFRNERSKDMAFKEIVDQLVRTENGLWVHKSGISIADYVKQFSDIEDNAFLFKAKGSSGTGSSGGGRSPSVNEEPKSLFDIPQEKVLEMARQGKLPRRQQ